MTDIKLIEGKIIHWEIGDQFTIKSDDGDKFSFWYPHEVSPERTELLTAMQYRKTVKVIVQVEDDE